MEHGALLKALGQDRVLDFTKRRSDPSTFDLAPAQPETDELPSPDLREPMYPPGKYSRSRIAYLKSIGRFNPSIHLPKE
jgi:hypothetical protein